MSYNITSTQILSGALRIDVNDLLRLRARHRDQLPASNFIDIMAERFDALDEKPREMPIPTFWWSGDFSGMHWEWFLADVVPCLRGTADVLFVWENGDSRTGIRIENDRAVVCDVVQTLVPRASKDES